MRKINVGMTSSANMSHSKDKEMFVMPTETIVVLAVIIAAFAAFMAVAAYGDLQTRRISKG